MVGAAEITYSATEGHVAFLFQKNEICSIKCSSRLVFINMVYTRGNLGIAGRQISKATEITWTQMIRPSQANKNWGVGICFHEHRKFHPFIDRLVVSTGAEYFGVMIIFMENNRIRYSLMGRYSSREKRSHDRLYLA